MDTDSSLNSQPNKLEVQFGHKETPKLETKEEWKTSKRSPIKINPSLPKGKMKMVLS